MAKKMPDRDSLDRFMKSREYAAQVGERLREARLWACLSESGAFRPLGMGHSRIEQIESGEVIPSLTEITKLALLYDCSVDWLLGVSGVPDVRDACEESADSELHPVENIAEIELGSGVGSHHGCRGARPVSPEVRRRMCKSKVRYATEGGAIHGAIRASDLLGIPMRQYRCPLCAGWHITSRTTSVDKAS